MDKYFNRIIIASLICLWLTWHMLIITVKASYQIGANGYVWIFGFYIHGSILIDLVIWIGLILLFILLVIIE